MAAGLGFKTFTTGEVLTAGDVNGYLMQGINVFASEAARNAAITAPQEGQFAFTKDTNSLWYYTGSAWAASGATGDIEGVTAGVGITGGGTSGTVTITNDMATTITASGDIVVGTGSGTYDNLPIGTTGQILTADTTVSPYKVKWATPASGSTFVGASAWMNSTVAIPNATFTSVALADEIFDTNSIHSNVTNNSRMTIPAGYAGKWLINGSLLWQSGTGIRSIAVYKNGTYYGIWDITPAASGSIYQTMSVVLSLAVSDYIEMFVYQTSGGNLNLYGNSAGNGTVTALSVSYLGA
jgi:hypothetical protein